MTTLSIKVTIKKEDGAIIKEGVFHQVERATIDEFIPTYNAEEKKRLGTIANKIYRKVRVVNSLTGFSELIHFKPGEKVIMEVLEMGKQALKGDEDESET